MDLLKNFLKKARKIHGDKYDYSKVEYKTCKEKVCIICPEHGEFWQTPDNHINAKQGCPVCGKNKASKNETLTNEQFIKKAKKVHGNKYDYSKTKYINSREKVCIICPEHGEFWQLPGNHLRGGDCYKCGKKTMANTQKKENDSFVEEANNIHGDKYDYSKVEYINAHTKVCIICPEHGEFWQTPHSHLRGRGCPKCAGKGYTNDEIIDSFKKVHGNKYDYSKVEYKKQKSKVCIICPEHGEFWQTPDKHLRGQGCPSCSESKLEREIEDELLKRDIQFIRKMHLTWLGKQHLDFYLPDYGVAIECQGEQHFYPVDFAGKGKEWARQKYESIKKMDIKKHELCKENLKEIYYFAKIKRKKFLGEPIYNECEEIINEIIRKGNIYIKIVFKNE